MMRRAARRRVRRAATGRPRRGARRRPRRGAGRRSRWAERWCLGRAERRSLRGAERGRLRRVKGWAQRRVGSGLPGGPRRRARAHPVHRVHCGALGRDANARHHLAPPVASAAREPDAVRVQDGVSALFEGRSESLTPALVLRAPHSLGSRRDPARGWSRPTAWGWFSCCTR